MLTFVEEARGDEAADPAALSAGLVGELDALIDSYGPEVLAELPARALDRCVEGGASLLHHFAVRSLDWVEAALARGADATVTTTADAELALVPGFDLGKYSAVRLPAGASPRTAAEKVAGRLKVVDKLLTKKGDYAESAEARAEQLERLEVIVVRLARAEQPDVEVPDEPQEVELAETSDVDKERLKREMKTGKVATPEALVAWLDRRARRLLPLHALDIAFAIPPSPLCAALVDVAVEGAERDVLGKLAAATVTVGHAAALSGAARHLELAREVDADWFARSHLGAPVERAVRRAHFGVLDEALGAADASHAGILEEMTVLAASLGRREVFDRLRAAGFEIPDRGLAAVVRQGWFEVFEERLAAGARPQCFGTIVGREEPLLAQLEAHGVPVDQLSNLDWYSVASEGTRKEETDEAVWKRNVEALLARNTLRTDAILSVLMARAEDWSPIGIERTKWILDRIVDEGVDWAAAPERPEAESLMGWALAEGPLYLLQHLHARGAPLPDPLVVRGFWEAADAKRAWLETVADLTERTLAERLEDPTTFDDPEAVVKRALNDDGSVYGLRIGMGVDAVAALGLRRKGGVHQSFTGPGQRGLRLHYEISGAGEVREIGFTLVVGPEERDAYRDAMRGRLTEVWGEADGRGKRWVKDGAEAEIWSHFDSDGLTAVVDVKVVPCA